MKRFGILLGIMLLAVSFSLYAEESVLIDFSTLTADLEDGNNEATIVDFSGKAGVGYTDEEKQLMKTSLAIEKWDVNLASSSQTVTNEKLSYTKEAPVSEQASKFAGETVMGVRIHFPEEPFNSYAVIKPPFEIPGYMRKTQLQADGTLVEDETDREGSKFDGYGVVKNVGAIKSIAVDVYGSNFPNGLGIILKDERGEERTMFLDYMDFNGWRTLGWVNPNYISDVRNRELHKYPLYPRTTPMRRLVGFIVYKDAAQEGGDIITYIKDAKVTYDLAVIPGTGDIDNEALWGILDSRESSRRTAEWRRLGEIQVLRALEARKIHQDSSESAAPAATTNP
ncbi:flagellar filament outer layer protein FlaA [Sediminispirochaeta bajacaliforniensis]|uniref:flagellar filament outer layer protein FlaA n=1 Tax=Sediminispirochaeta bajacaliforniensis TaxID=148 RepID=UPI000368BA1C|nr:flagellar filament outer layer protein FlaA [Sediminispirochaeta bajacaliforniensis]